MFGSNSRRRARRFPAQCHRAIVRFQHEITQAYFGVLFLPVLLGHERSIFGAKLGGTVRRDERVRVPARRFDALPCLGEPFARFTRRFMSSGTFRSS